AELPRTRIRDHVLSGEGVIRIDPDRHPRHHAAALGDDARGGEIRGPVPGDRPVPPEIRAGVDRRPVTPARGELVDLESRADRPAADPATGVDRVEQRRTVGRPRDATGTFAAPDGYERLLRTADDRSDVQLGPGRVERPVRDLPTVRRDCED